MTSPSRPRLLGIRLRWNACGESIPAWPRCPLKPQRTHVWTLWRDLSRHPHLCQRQERELLMNGNRRHQPRQRRPEDTMSPGEPPCLLPQFLESPGHGRYLAQCLHRHQNRNLEPSGLILDPALVRHRFVGNVSRVLPQLCLSYPTMCGIRLRRRRSSPTPALFTPPRFGRVLRLSRSHELWRALSTRL